MLPKYLTWKISQQYSTTCTHCQGPSRGVGRGRANKGPWVGFMKPLLDGLSPGGHRVKGDWSRTTGAHLVRTFKVEKQGHVLETLPEAKQGRAYPLTDGEKLWRGPIPVTLCRGPGRGVRAGGAYGGSQCGPEGCFFHPHTDKLIGFLATGKGLSESVPLPPCFLKFPHQWPKSLVPL